VVVDSKNTIIATSCFGLVWTEKCYQWFISISKKLPENSVSNFSDILVTEAEKTCMSTDNLKFYLNSCLWPSLELAGLKKYFLLCDSWSFNKNNDIFEELQKFHSIFKLNVADITGTSKIYQLLDVFYFRPLFVRHITDFLETDELMNCDNFTKLQSLWYTDNLERQSLVIWSSMSIINQAI